MKRQHLSKTQKAIIASPQTQSNQSDRSSPHPIEELQGAIGNRAVNQLLTSKPKLQAKPMFRGLSHELIQTKLTIGTPGDKYEQEADAVANQIVNQINAPEPSEIQRKEMSEEDEQLQMKPTVQCIGEGNSLTAGSALETSIQQAKSGGQPLPEPIRQPAEQAFQMPLDWVKIHTDGESDRLNQSINSVGFTNQNHIFLRQQVSNPNNRENQKIYFHELTHAVQQQGGTPKNSLQRKIQPAQVSAAPNILIQRQTLRECLNDPIGTNFRAFVERQLATENLIFWEAVQQYKRNYPALANTQAGADLAMSLYNEYINPRKPESPTLVNISYEQQIEIANKLLPDNHPEQQDLTDLFDHAEEEIFKLLYFLHIRFISSRAQQSQPQAQPQQSQPQAQPQQSGGWVSKLKKVFKLRGG